MFKMSKRKCEANLKVSSRHSPQNNNHQKPALIFLDDSIEPRPNKPWGWPEMLSKLCYGIY